ncbi:hypothetical protein N825_22805 [Skermanella stibiiresistens SB22]|uniref:Uncharacterized protein n=1 Tax=Skermanella stibiiresistens SB22 TaxID=1385369 RepID=W9GSS5_9PROT|nr:hypothetical protein N825_22805 [Skermanella stibiiresistens SB22]
MKAPAVPKIEHGDRFPYAWICPLVAGGLQAVDRQGGVRARVS